MSNTHKKRGTVFVTFTVPPGFFLFSYKMIQSALEISPEIFHQESALHQHLSCVGLIRSFQFIYRLRVKTFEEYLSGMAVRYSEHLHISYKDLFFVT